MNLTAIIINFLREPYLFNCINTLKEHYPDVKISVGENGKYTQEKKEKLEELGAEYHEIEWDGGVCVGRNRLVDKVKTKYVLVGDDDFGYIEKSQIDKMVEFLDNHPEFDLIGGRIIEGGKIKNYQGNIEQNNDNFIYTAFDVENGEYKTCNKTSLRYAKVDLTFNFFVARTEAIKKTQWDEKIKVAYEHSDFFIRFVNNGYNVAFSPDLLVEHKPTVSGLKNIAEYKTFRCRRSDRKRFFNKYNLSYFVDMSGNKDIYSRPSIKLVDFCITTFERPEQLKKLLYSIVKYYPEANIYIADDGKRFDVKWYKALWDELFDLGLKNKPVAFNIEYDKGLSYKRNILISKTPNVYKLILEEDFIFTEKTDIKKMINFLEENFQYGLVGGSLSQNGNIRHFEGFFKFKRGVLKQIPLDYQNLKEVNDCDCVFNFFLAKKEIFNYTKWNEKIKIGGEHTGFFLNLQNSPWKVAYIPSVVINHDQFHPTNYKPFRTRLEFLPIMMKENGIKKMINFNGKTYELKDNKLIIKT